MLATAIAAVVALAGAVPQAPARWAEDHAGLISEATRQRLDLRLEGYQRATGHQVVLWIGDSIDGADLADWATRTFDAWDLGQRGQDDGVAIFVLAGDRTIDIEVGYGLEGQLTDLAAKRIIEEVIVPRMKAGQADEAITLGTDAVLAAIEGEPWQGASAPAGGRTEEASSSNLVFGGIVLVLFILLAVRRPRLALMLLISGFGGRRGGGGGGGFDGGGGRSGGGGARGGW